jgi:hypothetical protein
MSFDLVWYSAGKLDEEGYCVEVRIPFKSIRYSRKDTVQMGVIVERKITRRSERGTFPPFSPERGENWLTQMQPILFRGVEHYSLFELLPAVTYSRRSTLDRDKLTSEGGNADISLTAKYGITSELILDGTYNPDFSQVEADAGRIDINLRSPLFFPEKRPFFQEGSEVFDLGRPSSHDPLRAIVHTRNIVNPIAGMKVSGKLGAKNTISSIYAMDELPEDSGETENAQFAIFRFKRSLSEDSYLGGFFTGREHEGNYNRVFGTDGRLRVNQSSTLRFHAFLSQDRETEHLGSQNGHALGAEYGYSTRDLMMSFGGVDISTGFETDTGYISRQGVGTLKAQITPRFYPRSEFLRRISPGFLIQHTKDKFSNQWEAHNNLSLDFLFPKSSSASLRYNISSEIYSGKKFDTDGVRFSARSQPTKQFSLNFNYSFGKAIYYSTDPFQGRRRSGSLSTIYQPSQKLQSSLSITYTDFHRHSNSEKIYDYTIVRSRNTYQLNRYLFFRGIVEYNSFRRELLTDFLASFTYIPGTVIHFGYGSLFEKIRWQDGEYVPIRHYRETNRGIFFKASYLWRM